MSDKLEGPSLPNYHEWLTIGMGFLARLFPLGNTVVHITIECTEFLAIFNPIYFGKVHSWTGRYPALGVRILVVQISLFASIKF
jgi:hypothetical protein